MENREKKGCKGGGRASVAVRLFSPRLDGIQRSNVQHSTSTFKVQRSTLVLGQLKLNLFSESAPNRSILTREKAPTSWGILSRCNEAWQRFLSTEHEESKCQVEIKTAWLWSYVIPETTWKATPFWCPESTPLSHSYLSPRSQMPGSMPYKTKMAQISELGGDDIIIA